MNIEQVIEKIQRGEWSQRLSDVYVDEKMLDYQKKRYVSALTAFEKQYGDGEISIFSAPGRSEVGGNHTDHQYGEVLAASINLDTIGVVKKTEDRMVRVLSDEYAEVVLTLDDLSVREEEMGTTAALVRGVIAGFAKKGYLFGGFHAYVTSDVLVGAGLSSSAAFETLMGTILSELYNDGNISAIEIAMIGQYAENVYFGKPCGLMDQMACSVGSLVHIDFANREQPVVEKVTFDMTEHGYYLCITDTKGSHADLTDEYAAIPREMSAVAKYFGKEVLCDVTEKDILDEMMPIRSKLGDRCVLRALHFLEENKRVQEEVKALKQGDVVSFLACVKASGDSSYKYLQNIYANNDVKTQNISLALALSEMFLKKDGVCRVHGGGFAGTIQAFVKKEVVEEYQKYMDRIFGEDSCRVLQIRKYGGMKVL